MNALLREIRDLLAFLVKQAKRHDLDEIRITITRATTLIHAINKLI